MSEKNEDRDKKDDLKKNVTGRAEKEENEDEINADANRFTNNQLEDFQDDMLQDEEKIGRETNQRSKNP